MSEKFPDSLDQANLIEDLDKARMMAEAEDGNQVRAKEARQDVAEAEQHIADDPNGFSVNKFSGRLVTHEAWADQRKKEAGISQGLAELNGEKAGLKYDALKNRSVNAQNLAEEAMSVAYFPSTPEGSDDRIDDINKARVMAKAQEPYQAAAIETRDKAVAAAQRIVENPKQLSIRNPYNNQLMSPEAYVKQEIDWANNAQQLGEMYAGRTGEAYDKAKESAEDAA